MPKDARGVVMPGTERHVWVLVAAMVAVAGCGDGNNPPSLGDSYPIQGKLILPDGKPLPGVRVVFTGPATNSLTTKSDGTFASQGDREGLPAGEYKVRLEVAESRGNTRRPSLPFPNQYLDEDTNDLTATVKSEGPNDFSFQLVKGENHGGKSVGSPRSRR